jgi:hypothetical protein
VNPQEYFSGQETIKRHTGRTQADTRREIGEACERIKKKYGTQPHPLDEVPLASAAVERNRAKDYYDQIEALQTELNESMRHDVVSETQLAELEIMPPVFPDE